MDAPAAHTTWIPRRRERIDGGRWVSIRPIERTDAAGLSDFYAGLSAQSLRRRFLGSGALPDARTLARFTDADGDGLVAILEERGPNDGAIVAHASLQAAAGGEAEVAFAVADELQGRGIGRMLMRTALEQAQGRAFDRVTATLLADNGSMRRLLRGAGHEVIRDEMHAGVEEISLRVAAPADLPVVTRGLSPRRPGPRSPWRR